MSAQPPRKPRVRKTRPAGGTTPTTPAPQAASPGGMGGNQLPPTQGGGGQPPQLPLDQRVARFLIGLFPRLSSLYTYLWVGLLAIFALHIFAATVSGWGQVGKLLMLIIELSIFLAVSFVWFHPFLMAAEIATVTGEAIIDPDTEIGKNIIAVVKRSASAFLSIGIAGIIVPATVMMIFDVSLNIFESIGLLILGIFAGLLAWRLNPEGDLVLRLTLAALVGAIVKILAGKIPEEAYGAADIAHYAGWIGMTFGLITFFDWSTLKSTTSEGMKLLHPKKVLVFLGGLAILLFVAGILLVFIKPDIPAAVVNGAVENVREFGGAVGGEEKPADQTTPPAAQSSDPLAKAKSEVTGGELVPLVPLPKARINCRQWVPVPGALTTYEPKNGVRQLVQNVPAGWYRLTTTGTIINQMTDGATTLYPSGELKYFPGKVVSSTIPLPASASGEEQGNYFLAVILKGDGVFRYVGAERIFEKKKGGELQISTNQNGPSLNLGGSIQVQLERCSKQ